MAPNLYIINVGTDIVSATDEPSYISVSGYTTWDEVNKVKMESSIVCRPGKDYDDTMRKLKAENPSFSTMHL